jgi:hypothetical protein
MAEPVNQVLTKGNEMEIFKASIKHMFITGAAGGTYIYAYVFDIHEINLSIVACLGAGWGVFLAALRKQPMGFYAASIGANCALASATYATFQDMLVRSRAKQDVVSYVLPGTLTGGTLISLAATPRRGIYGAVAGSVFGGCVYFAEKQFQVWRRKKAYERYKAKHGDGCRMHTRLPKDLDGEMDMNGRSASTQSILVEEEIKAQRFDLPSLVPSFMSISDDEIEVRVQRRLEELRLEAASSS